MPEPLRHWPYSRFPGHLGSDSGASPKPLHVEAVLAGEWALALRPGSSVVLSPDRRLVAYITEQGITERLYLRSLGQFEGRVVEGTESASNPFFSPDGQWVGFFRRRALWKVPIFGGAATKLCDVVPNSREPPRSLRGRSF